VAGNAVRQVEERLEPVFVRPTELFDFIPALRAADYRADSDDEDVVQLVLARALDARIANKMETFPDRLARTGPQSLEIPDMEVLGCVRPRLELRCVAPDGNGGFA
jgi:hypothetical protein